MAAEECAGMDVAGNHSSEDVPEQQTLAAGLPEWARERADGRWYEPSAAGQSSQPAEPKAPTSLIVVLPDEDGNDWAKARVFDSPEEATALVQTLVEGGLAPQGMSVFSATRMVVHVAYRPVVELKQSRKRSKPRG